MGEFFVRMLNGFAGPATWMATTKGLSPSVKKDSIHIIIDQQSSHLNFVKDIPRK